MPARRQGGSGPQAAPASRRAPENPSNKTWRVSSVSQETRLVSRVEPVYPEEARKAGIQGVVLLDVAVAPTGVVFETRVLRGDPMLAKAAVAAVQRWRYEPLVINGQPVAVVATVPVEFRLKEQ